MPNRTKDIVFIALFTALIAVGAFIKIPFGLVPFTLQTMFVIMAGLILGHKKAIIATLIYMLIGLIGVPIFTEGGGLSYILKPTFGYILGFNLSAFITGYLYNKFAKKTFLTAFFSGFLGVLSIYIVGVPYLYMVSHIYLNTAITAQALLINCFLIFLPTDILTMFLAVLLSTKLKKHSAI